MEFWTLVAQFGPGVFFALVVLVAYQKNVTKLISVIEKNTEAFVTMGSAVVQATSHTERLDKKLVDVLRTNTDAIESGATALGALGVKIESIERAVERAQK